MVPGDRQRQQGNHTETDDEHGARVDRDRRGAAANRLLDERDARGKDEAEETAGAQVGGGANAARALGLRAQECNNRRK